MPTVRRAVVHGAMCLALAVSAACSDDADDDDETPTPPEATGASSFALESPAFADGGDIPDEFTCDGAGDSPPLTWSGLPDGTVDLALTVVDPDAPGGNFVHWIASGIDPASGALAEDPSVADIRQAENATGSTGYLPPCPPDDDDPHHYVFTLYALDQRLVVAGGLGLDGFADAVADSTLGTAELTGRYARS